MMDIMHFRLGRINKQEMICDLMYCEMICENRTEIIDELYTKEQKKFMKSMKNFPSVIRTEYGYALKVEKDMAKVDKIKNRFEKCVKTHPYACEIEAEREFMYILDNKI